MRTLTLLLSLFVSSTLFGQNYKLVPDTCTLCMYFWGPSGGPLWQASYHVDPSQDTIIDSNTYVKILGSVRPYQPSFIRQEGDVLFGRVNDSLVDVKIMDFDVQVGDTIDSLYSEGFLYRARVDVKDSFLLNDGSYNTTIDLEVISVFNNGGWQGDSWYIFWSEGGLCNIHNYQSTYGLGGIFYNMRDNYYQGLEIAYYAPSYCTLDSNYTMTNGSTCQYCVGQSGNAGIDELIASRVKLYPNPTNHKLTLEFESTNQRELLVTNALGELILTIEGIGQMYALDVSRMKRGLYFIEVMENESRVRKVFVKN